MYLAYFDESGDAGLVNSPTKFFVLSCALVHETRWLETLDGLVRMRARIRRQHGISPRPEIKSSDIRRGQGPLVPLRWSLARRMLFYQNIMRYQASVLTGMKVFAVAIEKASANQRGREPRETAWEFALQRVNRFCDDDDERALQLADWNAYAAHRSSYVDPLPGVPPDLWDHLGDRLLLEVNWVSGGPPGIKMYP